MFHQVEGNTVFLLKAIGQGAIASDIEPGQLVATLEAGDRLCE